ncbi:MAG: substrate-binding domain-containing protein [Frankiales bacterium]|nr:substrate-binding domain-containing protein [Frankiales bacterium]
MSKRSLAVAGAVALSLLLAACGSSTATDTSSSPASSDTAAASSPAASGGTVGVILPDTASSARWETADRPLLMDAFNAAGVTADIQNANGDKTKFATLCDQFISNGVSVLMIVNLDSDTGKACETKAAAQGIKTIDYDRLTLGGGASYYVSFDNVAVGTAQGEGLVKCMQDNGDKTGGVVLLNGSPTDNNATLFKQGYEKAIKDAGYTIVADQSVPDWDNTKAGTIFEQIYAQQAGKFVGVDAANDGLGGAVIAVLKKNGLAGKIPVTGQDATDEGLQRVLLGTQCMTVYKAIKKEADAASALAIALIQGDQAKADSLATGKTADSTTGKDVPSVLLTPQGITAATVKDVVADGFTTAAKLCTTAELKAACTKYGVS